MPLVTEIERFRDRMDDGRRLKPFVRHALKCDHCGRMGEYTYGDDTDWYRGLCRAGAESNGFTHYQLGSVMKLRCTDGCPNAAPQREGHGE